MTPELKERIRVLTEEGVGQKQIGRALGISRSTTHLCQKKLGLCLPRHGRRCPPLSEAKESEVLRLLKAGRGTSWIPKHVDGVTEHQARLTKEKFNVRRKPGEVGCRYEVSEDLRQKVIDAIILRQDFCGNIAARFNVSDKFVRKLAHELLGVPAFRSGYGEPLLSNFPQKRHDGASN